MPFAQPARSLTREVLVETRFFEVSNGFNWGKFLVARYSPEEWIRESVHPDAHEPSLLVGRGWVPKHIFVMDLQTGEGALFAHGGSASYDVEAKHHIWVCPMFVPFLTWLYTQPVDTIMELPRLVELTEHEAPSAISGKRGDGTDAIHR